MLLLERYVWPLTGRTCPLHPGAGLIHPNRLCAQVIHLSLCEAPTECGAARAPLAVCTQCVDGGKHGSFNQCVGSPRVPIFDQIR